MGGVAGHMDHLYDNRELTFSEMKEIMKAGANAELDVEEKVDGQNLFLSYSLKNDELIGVPDKGGKAKGARNKGNLKAGGLDAIGLARKFSGRGPLEKAFTGAFSAFEKAVEALSDEEKVKIFGPDTDIWYNAEVMDPGNANVILYDDKTLKIHDVGHFSFDRESGEKSPIPEGALETLDNALERMAQQLQGDDFKLARRAAIQLKKLENKEFLTTAISKIDSAIAPEGLSDRNNIQDYLYSRLLNGIQADLPENLKKELVKYLLGIPGNIGKRALKSGLSNEDKRDLDGIIANKRNLLLEAIMPIEFAVHDYTVEILKGLESVFIADNKKEVDRLKKELSLAVRSLTASGAEDPLTMEIMQRHLNKIKDFSQISTPIEAIVFDYNGHTYKFAGNFAPLNQILGMFRYPKNNKAITTEDIDYTISTLTEQDGKKVALLPGGFKPPHAGHYKLAKELSSLPEIDEVIVIIGKNSRFSKVEPQIEVSAEDSKSLWDIYTSKDDNIKVKIQKGNTPVSDVYDLIADKDYFSVGDTVVLGKSDKDEGDKRYSRAQSWAERHNPGVSVEEMVMPVYGGENMGGTALRDMIASNDKNKLASKLPDHLNDSDVEKIMALIFNKNENLNNLIDMTIEEISTMSSGAISLGANKTNSYNRSKKPKVKRPKRQRRR